MKTHRFSIDFQPAPLLEYKSLRKLERHIRLGEYTVVRKKLGALGDIFARKHCERAVTQKYIRFEEKVCQVQMLTKR